MGDRHVPRRHHHHQLKEEHMSTRTTIIGSARRTPARTTFAQQRSRRPSASLGTAATRSTSSWTRGKTSSWSSYDYVPLVRSREGRRRGGAGTAARLVRRVVRAALHQRDQDRGRRPQRRGSPTSSLSSTRRTSDHAVQGLRPHQHRVRRHHRHDRHERRRRPARPGHASRSSSRTPPRCTCRWFR